MAAAAAFNGEKSHTFDEMSSLFQIMSAVKTQNFESIISTIEDRKNMLLSSIETRNPKDVAEEYRSLTSLV